MIKSEKELERLLLKDCKSALIKSQERVYKIIDMFIQRFYADYDPIRYNRTYELMHSLVKSKIEKDGRGYKAKVYFDLDYLRSNYDTSKKPSGEQVMDAAAYGGHGADGLKVVYGGGANLWFEPLEVLDAEAIEILKQMLISEGIPIK